MFIFFLQLFVLFACSAGVGLFLRFFIPKDFSPLSKVLFSLTGGFFLVVLIAQNLIAICLYVVLRETGIERFKRFMAGSGALLAAFLPVVTRLAGRSWLPRRYITLWVINCLS